MKNVLLDTHVWIWISLGQHDKLSLKARNAFKRAKHKWISTISIWELAKLEEKQRIKFSIPLLTWIQRSLLDQDLVVAPLDPEICVESCSLPNFHKDPADQLIVATARIMALPLISADARIQAFSGIKTIW